MNIDIEEEIKIGRKVTAVSLLPDAPTHAPTHAVDACR